MIDGASGRRLHASSRTRSRATLRSDARATRTSVCAGGSPCACARVAPSHVRVTTPRLLDRGSARIPEAARRAHRERHEVLSQLPRLRGDRARQSCRDLWARDGDISVWSAGTASGEEAYSLAALFYEHAHARSEAHRRSDACRSQAPTSIAHRSRGGACRIRTSRVCGDRRRASRTHFPAVRTAGDGARGGPRAHSVRAPRPAREPAASAELRSHRLPKRHHLPRS